MTERVSVQFPRELTARIDERAETERRSRSNMARVLVERGLARVLVDGLEDDTKEAS